MAEKENDREELRQDGAEEEMKETAPDEEPKEASPDEILGAELAEEEPAEPEKDPEALLAEANDKYMRLAAEYQNYRRRTDEEKTGIAQYANERITKDLLNVVDSFERALETSEEADKGFRDGVELIYKQLMNVLNGFGVSVIETEGMDFDPNFHSAVLSEEAEGVEPGKILEVFQKGYMLHDRLLRPAMVKVSA